MTSHGGGIGGSDWDRDQRVVLRGQGDLGEEGGCQFELVGRGGTPPESCGYRSGGVGSQPTNPGSSPLPLPKHTSCLLSFYTVVGSRGPLEMRLFEEHGLPCDL